MTKETTTCRTCPYWSINDNRCTVSGTGLFVPLEKHIVKYCTSQRYSQCSIYKTEQLSLQRPPRPRKNRRKFPRILTEHQIILRKINNGNITSNKVTHNVANIEDLSAGGMKIAIKTPLNDNTLINFTLENPPSQDSLYGIAQVKWCRYEEKEMVFHAGLTFQNTSTTHAVSSRFDLPLH